MENQSITAAASVDAAEQTNSAVDQLTVQDTHQETEQKQGHDVKSILQKTWNIMSTVLVGIVVALALLLIVLRVSGYGFYTILSGSMEPTYMVGDMIIVKPVDPGTIKAGDPITFVMNERLQVATHRVVQVDKENEYFYTKGDNNNIADDAPVHFNNLIGKPIMKLPKFGYFSDWIQNPPGLYIALIIGVFLLTAAFLPDMIGRKEKSASDNNTSEQSASKTEEPNIEDPKS